mmetsp:Transcript_27455/g.69508  ORF Transcript_27455/g.69508 Transcript_27455/m.69508 type:complete len:214 (+) Transcript_27455:104-745(+)
MVRRADPARGDHVGCREADRTGSDGRAAGLRRGRVRRAAATVEPQQQRRAAGRRERAADAVGRLRVRAPSAALVCGQGPRPLTPGELPGGGDLDAGDAVLEGILPLEAPDGLDPGAQGLDLDAARLESGPAADQAADTAAREADGQRARAVELARGAPPAVARDAVARDRRHVAVRHALPARGAVVDQAHVEVARADGLLLYSGRRLRRLPTL